MRNDLLKSLYRHIEIVTAHVLLNVYAVSIVIYIQPEIVTYIQHFTLIVDTGYN